MNILLVRTENESNLAFEKLSKSTVIGCDTETSGLSARHAKIFSIQFSDGDLSVLVPFSEGVPLGLLARILENPAITKVFHNARFDLDFLRENSIGVENVLCTMIAEKVLTKGANQSVSLRETLYRHFAVDLDKSQRAKFNPNWNGIWTEELVDYALRDVIYLPQLLEQQTAWMKRLGLSDEFETQMKKLF